MLMPAFTIRPVPAQRRLPIIPWSSSTTASIRWLSLTVADVAAVCRRVDSSHDVNNLATVMIASRANVAPAARIRNAPRGGRGVRFALMIEPQQGLTYDEQLAIVQRAESVGFESFFRSDHYQSFPGPTGEPTTDAWAVLAGLARETSTITLGTLVSPVTFRPVGNLAKVVTTVDEMSGGRVEFGLGAGWNDGRASRSSGCRSRRSASAADMMEEQFAVLHGLWGEPDGWSFDGHARPDRGRVVPPEARRRGRAGRRPERPRPAAAPDRRRGLAAVDADRRPLLRRVQPVVVLARHRGREVRRAAARPARRSGAIPRRWRRSVMAGRADRAGRGRARSRRKSALLAAFGDETGGDAWFADAASRAGSWARRIRPGRWSSGSRRRARSGSCSRTSCRATSR